KAAAASVERIRAHRRVAYRDETVHERLALAVDERSVPVAQPGHDVHTGDRIGDTVDAPRRGRHERPGDGFEGIGHGEGPPHLFVMTLDRVGDREGPVVT